MLAPFADFIFFQQLHLEEVATKVGKYSTTFQIYFNILNWNSNYMPQLSELKILFFNRRWKHSHLGEPPIKGMVG